MSSERKWWTLRNLTTAAVVTAVIAVGAVAPGRVVAEHTGETAEQAAREILDARARANDAAQAMFDAESALDSLTLELDAAERDHAALEADVGELRDGLADRAVRQLVGAGESSLMLFRDIGSDSDRTAAFVYAGAATGSQLVVADDYDEAIRELDEARRTLERRRSETIDARDTWSALKSAAETEVLELQRIEEARLHDAEVQHELERQRQAQAEAQAEQERQERELAAQRAAEAQAAAEAEAAAAAQAAASAASSSGSSSGSSSSGSSSGGSSSGSSSSGSSSSGSSSGSSSAPPTTAAPAPAASAGSGMACPVAGPRSFADTWGAPRSGGRRHQGVDMMAPGGTPLVAVESGSVHFKTNRLGGNAIWLTGASGTKYYYAHLSAWEGSSRRVSRGEVIGYVGRTGNTSVNHLHFEVHPGGGSAVNPYPYVRAVC